MATYREPLGDDLYLCLVEDDRDAERYSAFQGQVFGANIARSIDYLMHHHPTMGRSDFIFVEDARRGVAVSTVCLIPWRCRYEQVVLDVAMLEAVVTHPDYRRRGLIRAQVQLFHRLVAQRGYDLSIIEGIPYYYRQYGYTYAVDHRAYDLLPAWRIPSPSKPSEGRYSLRRASPDDAAALACLYHLEVAREGFVNLRDADYWGFLLRWLEYPVRLVEEREGGRAVGYLSTMPLRESGGIRVLESAFEGRDATLVALSQLKQESSGEIQLGWPQNNTLVRVGRSLGSVPLPAYQWLLRVPSMTALLSKLAPTFERRLAASDCAGLSAELCLNLFHEAFVLRFEQGRWAGVDAVGFVDASMGADGGDLCIPPEAFVRLLFGYRTLAELRDAWPDIVIRPASQRILEVLFPQMSSYFLMPYLYCGPIGR